LVVSDRNAKAVSPTDPQAAPGPLEPVRVLLNTWLIPNDSRLPTDRFEDYRRQHRLGRRDADVLRELRDDLRMVVEGGRDPDPDGVLTRWIDRLGVQVVVDGGAVRFRHGGGTAGDTLMAVLDALASGTWARLKACPDCRWVFYDRTRSGTKRWCVMNAAGPDGRGCGNIAKARRHRARQKASRPPPAPRR
jgi:CGNR zinc finger